MRPQPKSRLYMEVQERIKEDIKHLPAHTRLPSRIQMIKKYGVTRTTIEKAISELEGRGLLYSAIGSGTYISQPIETVETAADSAVSTWGVVLPSITDDFYPIIVRGIEDIANSKGINVVLCNTDHDPDKQHAYMLKLVKSRVKGVIIVPAITKASTAAAFHLLRKHEIPFVFCNRVIENIEAPRVVSNNFYGAYMATRYAIGLGRRKIAYVAAPVYSIVEQRYQGYLGALQEAEIPLREDYVYVEETLDQEKAGYVGGLELMSRNDPPDAYICFNDIIAAGVCRAIEGNGLSVGKHIAVIGNGDMPICQSLPVKLTSVKYPAYETGLRAGEILWNMMRKVAVNTNMSVVLQPEMVIRESCGKILPP